VADLGFVAWGGVDNFKGAPTISKGHQIYRFRQLIVIREHESSNRINNLNNELGMFIKKYVYRIPMAVIYVQFEISFQGAPNFLQRSVGGDPPPTPIAGSATVFDRMPERKEKNHQC